MGRGSALRFAWALLLSSFLSGPGAPGHAANPVQTAIEDGGDSIARAGRRARAWLEGVPVVGPVAERVRISGSWMGAVLDSQERSQVQLEGFRTWDARLFVDVDLAEDLALGGREILDAAGIAFEWEFYRLGRESDDLGELYLDLQGLAGSPWLNVQLGRFQIPVGEAYLRYGKAWRENPFLSNPVSGAWWWDEGIRIHGAREDGRVGYVASLSSGETAENWRMDGGGQATLKLYGSPLRGLHVSASALWAGRAGDSDTPGETALWIGEDWGRAFGSRSPYPNLIGGRAVPDGPNRLDRTLFFGADAIVTRWRGVRLWLSYGYAEIDSSGPSFYDRALHSWLAEVVLDGRLVAPELHPLHVALRASGIGTYDDAKGYDLDIRSLFRFGYNGRSLEAYSVAVGWKLNRYARVLVEYTHQRVSLVEGASAAGLRGEPASYFGAALGLHF